MAEYRAPKCRFNLTNIDLKIGDIVYFDSSQEYTLTAFDETQDGKTFLHWKAPCISCGKLFDSTTARTVIGTGLTRNCIKHRGNRIKEGGKISRKAERAAIEKVKPAVVVAEKTVTPKPDKAKSGPNIKYWCWVTDSWLPEAELNRVMAEYKAKQDIKAKKDDII